MKKVKKWKQLFCVALNFIMILSMSMMTFAQATTDPSTSSKTCTITAPDNGHTYYIYQIFTGDIAELDGKTVLANIKWGIHGTGKTDDPVGEDIISEFMKATSDSEIRTVAQKYATISGTPIAKLNSKNKTFTGQAGYYLIKDFPVRNVTLPEGDSYSLYMVSLAGNITIEPKNSVPSFEKKIKDTNDSTGTTSDWQDSADYDIGDSIPFKLEATVADDYAQYKSYSLTFHDQQESGLTFQPESVEISVTSNGYTFQIVTREYANLGITIKQKGADDPKYRATDGCTFEIIFSDLKKIQPGSNLNNAYITGGSKITVTYNSTLNENAVFGAYGNLNRAQLEFSNNPYSTSNKGKTPWDSVIAFTYKLQVNKWANSTDTSKGGSPLSGAEFTLEKQLSNNSWKTINVTTSNEGTTFTFKGLDDGKYRLTETQTPEGYNKIDPIEFTINANHDDIWVDQNREDILTSLNGSTTTGTITFTTVEDNPSDTNDHNSSLVTNVVNKSGSALPETGGIGTKLFYLVGSVFVIGAVVLLVTKKRMSAR